MPLGRMVLCLHTHMPYVLSHGKSPHGTDWLFEAAAECYLPLLDTLNRLRNQGIRPRWTFTMTPVLAEQLSDEAFKDGFEAYCQEKIDYALADQKKFIAEGETGLQGLAGFWQRIYTKALVHFKHEWNRDIIGAFRSFQEDGLIEIAASGATHGYLPLACTEESIAAQIRIGVETYKRHFGQAPQSFWLPECAYRPAGEWKAPAGEDEEVWPRPGLETHLAREGLKQFFVDSHMIRGGEPLGTYWQKFPQLAEMFARSRKLFEAPVEDRSEYEPYGINEGLTVFARDPETTVRVWSGDVGYPGDPRYLEFHKQLYPGRHRYWRISENKADLGAKQPYDPWQAYEQIAGHARDFVQVMKGALAHYRGETGKEGTITAMYDTELFGHWWWEGPEFLYEAAVALHNDPDIESLTPSELVEEHPPKRQINMPEGSWGEGGYHSVWLNNDNHWIWEHLYPAQRRMRELAGRVGESELADRIITQAGRELLLAEASDWPFLISTFSAKDYAEARFSDHIERFNRLAAMSEQSSLSEEETAFLEECEEKDSLFADLNPSLWQSGTTQGSIAALK